MIISTIGNTELGAKVRLVGATHLSAQSGGPKVERVGHGTCGGWWVES